MTETWGKLSPEHSLLNTGLATSKQWFVLPNTVQAVFHLLLMTTYDLLNLLLHFLHSYCATFHPPTPRRARLPPSPKQVGDHTIHLDYDGTNALYLPTTSEAIDSAVRSKYDDTVDADPTLPPVWSPDTLGARTKIQISGDIVPTVLSVSAPGTVNGTTYGVGEEIDVEVAFSARIFVKDSHSLPYVLVEAGEGRSGEAQVGEMGKYLPCMLHDAVRGISRIWCTRFKWKVQEREEIRFSENERAEQLFWS